MCIKAAVKILLLKRWITLTGISRVSCTYEVQKYVGSTVAMKCQAEWSPGFKSFPSVTDLSTHDMPRVLTEILYLILENAPIKCQA